MMTKQEYQSQAAQGYNRIPLVQELLADLDTPLSLYLKLANRPFSYLLESVVGGERFGRYSFIGCRAILISKFPAAPPKSTATTNLPKRTKATRCTLSSSSTPASKRPKFPSCPASPADWSAISATRAFTISNTSPTA